MQMRHGGVSRVSAAPDLHARSDRHAGTNLQASGDEVREQGELAVSMVDNDEVSVHVVSVHDRREVLWHAVDGDDHDARGIGHDRLVVRGKVRIDPQGAAKTSAVRNVDDEIQCVGLIVCRPVMGAVHFPIAHDGKAILKGTWLGNCVCPREFQQRWRRFTPTGRDERCARENGRDEEKRTHVRYSNGSWVRG